MAKKRKVEHGYTTKDGPNKKPLGIHNKGLLPPPQVAVEGMKQIDAIVEVGQRRYQLQGNAKDVVEFLEENKDMKFVAHTLGVDEQWGKGKDPNNKNVKISVSVPGAPLEEPLDAARNAAKDLLLRTVVKPISTNGAKTALHDGADTLLDPAKKVAQSGEATFRNRTKVLPVAKALASNPKAPLVGPNLIPRSVRIAKVKIDHKAETLKGIPKIGSKIGKFAETRIIIKVDPYMNANKEQGTTFDMGAEELKFGELASFIKTNVLAEKTKKEQKQEQNNPTVIDPNPVPSGFLSPSIAESSKGQKASLKDETGRKRSRSLDSPQPSATKKENNNKRGRSM